MLKTFWQFAFAGLLLGFQSRNAEAAVVSPQAGPFIVEVIRAENPLPQSSVLAMTQTRDGFLWLGTVKGLARFDGYRFEVFTEWNTPSLGGNTIVCLFNDSRGGLWVGTESGGVRLIKDGRMTDVGFGGGGPGGRLASACEDVAGAVWLHTADGRLARFRDGAIEKTWALDLGFSTCRSVIAEPSGQVWIGSDWNLFRVVSDVQAKPFTLLLQTNSLPGKQDFLLASRAGGYWQFANGRVFKRQTNRAERDFGTYPWGSARIMSACEDREGNLIVGTQNGGVYWFDPAGSSRRVEGLTHNTALSLHVDREGSLWVGTDGGGLQRVKRKVFEVAPRSLGKVVQSVCADASGGLWAGFNGGGATYWKDGVVQDFGPNEGLFGAGENRNPNFSAVLVDRQQRVWVGTRDFGLYQFVNGAFQFTPDRRLFGRNVSAIFQDRSNRLWVGTDAGLALWDEREWKTFSPAEGLSAADVTALADDAQGNLWIGTERGGLNRLRDGRFTSFHVSDGLPAENITSLLADADGALWIGTGNGLARLRDGKWTRFTKREGLAGEGIGYLLEDDRGHLWIGSNAGLMCVAKSALNDFADGKINFVACRAYGEADGLPTEECTQGSQPAACRTSDGRLLFPTIKGLVSINPAQLNPNTNPPPVVIESVFIESREQNTNHFDSAGLRSVTMRPGSERVEIVYASLNLAAPELARFKYRMEGHEKDWIDAGNSRIARYTKLPPDEYRFQVIACNEDGVWNKDGATLAVTVLPPFWQTWWFRSATGVGLLGMIIGAVYYASTQKLQRQLQSLRQHEALEKERSRIARDLHDELGANLTQVALLGELVESDKDLPDEVEVHARQISQTARETTRSLDEIVWEANPSNDTLESLVTYACKYAQEYLAVAGLRYRLDVPDVLPAATIPPEVRHNVFLAFKEAVNNVVKHAQATAVQVRLRLTPNRFTLEIEDNGRGLPNLDGKPGRNGLRNMRKRMEDIGGDFSIGAPPEGGTLIGLSAPVTKR